MIRNRIIVGLLDAGVLMKLQLDSKLTLEKATVVARQNESVKRQQDIVRGEQKPSSIKAVTSKKFGGKGGSYKNVSKSNISHPLTAA